MTNEKINQYAFQTRARTVDHLGREQIADCPTAISELWKNAFDAYARNVQLNIYDGEEPAATIVDDGHGMNRDEFLDRWLVVGTESKVTKARSPREDRNGLRIRPRQGQKGIGRLSCANLGPLLLLVSKRRKDQFIAALIDWRLFENPFINLTDIFIPTVEFAEADNLFEHLPALVNTLSENVNGGTDESRKERIKLAWATFDRLHEDTHNSSRYNGSLPPSQEILSTISHVPFEPRHFHEWPVWGGTCNHGTALLVSGINYDLRVLLKGSVSDSSADATKKRFFETLSSFVNPFIDPVNPTNMKTDPQFTYSVCVWDGDTHEVIIGSEKQFDKRQTNGMEHLIEGHVDSEGIFTGRVRAFGEWLPDDCVIKPLDDLMIPHRSDSLLGPFTLYIASMEFEAMNTTHSDSEFRFYKDLAEKYSGFMVFRDGLRVLPYGRTDNDFFEIESRRTRSAGREFWNHRQMFGCIEITRDNNPNLKDKAGREGLLDNRAAKTLRELVANILMQSARRYFGSSSKIRKDLLPQISADNKRRRAKEERDKLRRRYRKKFRDKLDQFSHELPELIRDVKHFAEALHIDTDKEISEAQLEMDKFYERLANLILPSTLSI